MSISCRVLLFTAGKQSEKHCTLCIASYYGCGSHAWCVLIYSNQLEVAISVQLLLIFIQWQYTNSYEQYGVLTHPGHLAIPRTVIL